MNSVDLNDPPTSVAGIPEFVERVRCRKDLNNPPTAVGGIVGYLYVITAIAYSADPQCHDATNGITP